jgi:translation initiation factor IF-3
MKKKNEMKKKKEKNEWNEWRIKWNLDQDNINWKFET